MKKHAKQAGRLVCGFVAFLAVTTAWAVPPLSYTLDPVDIEGAPFFDCTPFGMNFLVLADFTYHEYGKTHFDQDGNWAKVNSFWFSTNQHGYNSEEPTKEVTVDDLAGTGEHGHFITYYDEDQVPIFQKEAGIIFRMVIPGEGALSMNAGAVTSEFDGTNWTVTKITPNRVVSEEDAYAVCSYLQ